MAELKRRILNLLIAADQMLFCLLTLGHSHPDETVSAWAWRAESAGKWQGKVMRPLIDAIFWFDPAHCMNSYLSEHRGRQLPSHYREARVRE